MIENILLVIGKIASYIFLGLICFVGVISLTYTKINWPENFKKFFDCL